MGRLYSAAFPLLLLTRLPILSPLYIKYQSNDYPRVESWPDLVEVDREGQGAVSGVGEERDERGRGGG